MAGARTDSEAVRAWGSSVTGPRATAAFALTVAMVSGAAQAQTASPRFDAISPVAGQPDNPGVGQETGANGLPVLRRGYSESDPSGRGRVPTSFNSGGDSGAGTSQLGASGQSFPSATGLTGPTSRPGSGGDRTGGVSTGTNNRALSGPLRVRAAPPRRAGIATKQTIREVTQITTQSPTLVPIVQQPVSGVPLPASTASQRLPILAQSAVLGLLTPGFILGTDVSRPIPTDPAYAPIGFKLGSFTVLPSFTQGIGYDSNPDQTTRQFAKGSVAFRTEATADFRSDWSSSSLDGSLRGAYFETPQNEMASRPSADGIVNLRIDATRDLQLTAQARAIIDTQRTSSPNLQAVTATGRPQIALYGGTIGATQTFNRLSVTVAGAVDRSEFEDARLSNGSVIRQSDRNLNQYSLRLRTAYEVTPDFAPFVDVIADTRVYDQRVDIFGVRRDSDGLSLLGGARVAFGRTLTGEVSAGAQRRDYVDRTLRNIDAPLINANLSWAATPLTTIRLNAATGVTETTIPGSSGVLTQVGTLEVQHDLFRNLSIVLGGSILHNEYKNSPIREDGFSTTARFDYRLTRWLTLRAAYIFQEVHSTSAGSSFRDNTVLVGMRVNP